MTCENCKVEFTSRRRNCYLCGANIGLHDKWFFDERAGGKPRHRHCDNPESYFLRERNLGTIRFVEYGSWVLPPNPDDELQRELERLASG